VLEREGVCFGPGFNGAEKGPASAFCEHDYEPSSGTGHQISRTAESPPAFKGRICIVDVVRPTTFQLLRGGARSAGLLTVA
jgi:hypothetical protein